MELEGIPSTSRCNSSEFESFVVLYNSLMNGPFPHLAAKLEKEVNESGIVPTRLDYMGNEHHQTLKEFLHNRSLASISTVQSLLEDAKRNKLCLKKSDTDQPSVAKNLSSAHFPRRRICSHTKLLNARELGAIIPDKRFLDLNMIEKSFRITGHIDKTYNVRFDKTGQYVITASDDALIKVWDLNSAMLRYSFRGHPSLIADMDISFCNQFLASVGHDKIIRIWSLQNGAQVEVCRHHTNFVTCISFLPKVHGNKRWLVSFGSDCNVIFYEFDEQTKLFNDRALIFNVRTAPGLKVLSGTNSPCGNWVAAGDSHGFVHLFNFKESAYHDDTEFKAISVQEKLDTLEWSNTGLSFVACSSRCHAGRIWRYIDNVWRYVEFSPKLPEESVLRIFHSTKLKYGICMAIWSLDDSKIIVSGTDSKIRIFDAYTAEQIFCLDGHKSEPFHLKCHPIHENVAVSSAHDGFVILWDIERGKVLKKFTNEAKDDDNDVISSAILDCAFSPDGTVLSVVDDLGRLTVFGYGGSDLYKTPREQFFSSDYELLEIDDHEFPMDSITGLAPHLNNPPWLVDIQRAPLEEKWQKKVPGREVDIPDLICPWLTRNIISKLDSGMLNVWIQTQINLSMEADIYLNSHDNRFMLYKIPGTEEVVPIKPAASARRRAPIPTVEQVLQEQQERFMRDNLYGYRSEDDEDYQDASTPDRERLQNNESTDSDTSDESYEGERTRGEQELEEQKPVTTLSGRRVRSRNPQYNASPSRPTRRTRRTRVDTPVGEDDDDDIKEEPFEEDEPGPSTEEKPVIKDKKKRKEPKPEALATFPMSMQIVKPTRFPYVAQIGDRVVYCKQGHMNYNHRVEALGLYKISSKMQPRADLMAEEFCIVDDVKYTRKPFRLTCLRLAQLTRHNERSGFTFSVKYHDLEDSPDFIILRQQYDSAIACAFQEGHEMEAILDGCWWTGTITKREAVSEEFPNSLWNCLAVRWDNGDEDKMSPWECQPKTPGRKSGSLASAEEEVQLATYACSDDEWPGTGKATANMEKHCEQLYKAINKLSCVETVAAFSYPVNLAEFPSYSFLVDYCIDLQTIAERLKNHFYRRLESVQHDIRHIAVAAEQFNEPSSVIVRNSRRLVEALIKFSKDLYLDSEDIVKFYDSMFDLPDEEIKEYRRREIKREIEPDIFAMASSSQQQPPAEPGWIRDARNKLQTAFNQTCAKPFFDKDEAGNHAICVALAESGDLKSVLNELHLFSHPEGVVKKITTILDTCRDAVDDPRDRLHHSIDQLVKLVQQKMQSIVDEFNRACQSVGLDSRSLRKRTKKNIAYQTRSHAAECTTSSGRAAPEPGYFSRLVSGSLTMRSNDITHDRPIRVTRRTRQNCSSENSREATIEREPPQASRITRSSARSSRDSNPDAVKEELESEESECIENSSPRIALRRHQQELEEEVRELQDDAEERLDRRRAAPKLRKRRRRSTESDEDSLSNNSASSSRRPTRRSTRVKYEENNDDDEIPNISQFGRVRRARRFD